jgi:hypothetical protein
MKLLRMQYTSEKAGNIENVNMEAGELALQLLDCNTLDSTGIHTSYSYNLGCIFGVVDTCTNCV